MGGLCPERCSVGRLLSLVLLGLGIAASASAQTAREYFKELNAANTFNRYKDEYVCFRDDDVPSFAVIARVGDIIDHMKKSGDTAGVKNLEAAKDGLIVETYYKGVSSGTNVFSLAKRDDPSGDGKDYSYEFAGDNPGKMVYSINWVTGRYLQRLYMYQQSKSTAAREGSGKCEPIHPGRPSEIEPLPQPNIKLIYFGFDNHAEKEPDLLQLEKTWGEHPPCSH
jgi:hypothetical protein